MAQEADGRTGHGGRGSQDFRDGDGVEHQIGAENAHHEAKVADAVHDERLDRGGVGGRSDEHTSELQSLIRTSYAVFCLTKTNIHIISNLILKPHRYKNNNSNTTK